jgi:hypothetical protein
MCEGTHRITVWVSQFFAAAIVAAAVLPLFVSVAVSPSFAEEKAAKDKEKASISPRASEKPAAAPEDKSGVGLSGQVSQDSAGPRGLIRFWISVENRTEATLDDVQLRNPEIPGFALKRLCWPATPDNHCMEIRTDGDAPSMAQAPQAQYRLAEHLHPRQPVSVWGYLEATDSEPKQNAFVTVSWTVAGSPSSETVTLGEVESLNCLRALALQVIHGWEWSFPLATLIGGFLYDQWRRKREKKEKASERDRKSKERDREELRDHQKRTWNLMLPRSQQAALKFYTPLAGAAQSARDQLRKYQDSRQLGNLPGACFEMLFFHWRLRQAIDQIGGYYFKSPEAEQLADLIYCKHRYLLGLNDSTNRSLLSGAVDEIKPNTTIARFLQEKGNPRSKAHAFWTYFETWATTKSMELGRDIFVLDAYAALLRYEANRPSLHWYGKLDPISFALPESRKVISQWAPWKATDHLNLSDALVLEYEAMASRYLKEVEQPVDVTVKD